MLRYIPSIENGTIVAPTAHDWGVDEKVEILKRLLTPSVSTRFLIYVKAGNPYFSHRKGRCKRQIKRCWTPVYAGETKTDFIQEKLCQIP